MNQPSIMENHAKYYSRGVLRAAPPTGCGFKDLAQLDRASEALGPPTRLAHRLRTHALPSAPPPSAADSQHRRRIHVMTTVKKPPLSGSGYSRYLPGMVPGMRKCRITRHSGCVLAVGVTLYAPAGTAFTISMKRGLALTPVQQQGSVVLDSAVQQHGGVVL